MTVSAHARALVRWRRGLEHAVTMAQPDDRFDDWAFERRFDVAAARAYALELIALEDEHAVFTEWTVSKGKGPDNREPGVFDSNWSCASERGEPIESCAGCTGHGMVDMGNGDVQDCPEDCYHGQARKLHRGGWPGKLAREWPGDRRAPQGRSLARVGRRLRDMLDGKGDYKHAAKQPDECQACAPRKGVRMQHKGHGPCFDECPDCHGTGHNLGGYLPEVEWSPAAVRAAADAWAEAFVRNPTTAGDTAVDELSRRVLDECRQPSTCDGPALLTTLDDGTVLERTDTRVVPRGEHRRKVEAVDAGLDARLTARGLRREQRDPKRVPSWRRGELLHAQQRRERAQQRDVDAVREEWSFGRPHVERTA